jgi:hypothetical protein
MFAAKSKGLRVAVKPKVAVRVGAAKKQKLADEAPKSGLSMLAGLSSSSDSD